MEIPEDVMKAALEVRTHLCLDTVCTFPAGCGCLEVLAGAILAERERCAKIAEDASADIIAATIRASR